MFAAAAVAVAALLALMPERGGRAQENVPRPPNDDFNRPISTEPSVSPLGNDRRRFAWLQDTTGATLEPDEPQPCIAIGATVWFLYVAPTTSKVTADTSGSDYDTAVAIYRIDGFVPSPPGGSLSMIVCTDDGQPQKQAVLTASVETGRLYAIQVGGVGGATGMLRIVIDCVPFCAAENDRALTPATVHQLPYRDAPDTATATLDPGEPQPCGEIGATVWYLVRNQTETDVVIEATTTDSTFTTVLAVYEHDISETPSPPGSLRLIECADGTADPDSRASLRITVPPGSFYVVQAGGNAGATGALNFELACASALCRLSPEVRAADNGASPGDIGPPNTGSGGYFPGARR